jgi:hypothetical protein
VNVDEAVAVEDRRIVGKDKSAFTPDVRKGLGQRSLPDGERELFFQAGLGG